MFHPTISPHDPNTALVSCDMTGSYITHDGGKSWRMFNLRGVVQFFVFDPLKKDVIYAQATGLWRSQDNGETWALVYPRPSSVKAVKMNSDHSDEDIVAEPNPLGGNITAMAIDPEDSQRFYVAAGDRKQGSFGLFTSRDGGQTWEKKEALTELANRLWVDSASPKSERILLVAGSRFIAKRTSSGLQQFPGPPSKGFQDVSAGFRPDGKAIVYAVGDDS